MKMKITSVKEESLNLDNRWKSKYYDLFNSDKVREKWIKKSLDLQPNNREESEKELPEKLEKMVSIPYAQLIELLAYVRSVSGALEKYTDSGIKEGERNE